MSASLGRLLSWPLGLVVLLTALSARAQISAAARAPAPAVRFFAVPWLEGGSAWQAGRNNSYYTFQRGAAGQHLGGGLAVELMPSPNIGVGLGIGILGLGGSYSATYRVDEFFSQTSETYTLTRDLRLTYLRVPVYVRATPHLVGPLRGYALAGVEPALLLSVRSGEADLDAAGRAYADDYGFLDGALLGGLGLEWWLSANTALALGVHYRHGILGIQDDRPPRPGGDTPPLTDPFGQPRSYSAPFDVQYPLRNRALTLVVGVKFGPTRRRTATPPPAEHPLGAPPLRTI